MEPLSQQDSEIQTEEGILETPQPKNIHLVQDIFQKLEASDQYYWNKGKSHFFFRNGFGSVHSRFFEDKKNRSLLVISPGRGESSLKYAEIADSFKNKGFDILIMDHRGQGFSEKYAKCSDLGHVEDSRAYHEDLTFVVTHFKDKKFYDKTLLLGHSMGAAIALEALQKESDLFQGLILCSPMIGIKTRGVPSLIARFILGTAVKLKRGHKPLYRPLTDMRSSFHRNLKTSCLERFQFHMENENRHPQIKVGAPTIQWLQQGLSLTRRIDKAKKRLKAPILLVQADNDGLVCPKAQDRFARDVENCRIIRVKDSRHEVLQEVDNTRNRAMVQIEKFLKELS